jgi:hypothetical protein
MIANARATDPALQIDREFVARLIKKIPSKKQQVLYRMLAVLTENGLLPAGVEVKMRNSLASAPVLTGLLK